MIETTMPAQARIRVLQVVGNAIVGGMETFVLRLVQGLPRDRFEIACLCPFESGFTDQLRAAGASVHITPMHDEPAFASIQFATTLVRTLGIDILHAHLSNAHLLAGLAGALTETPVLSTVHGRAIPMLDFEVQRLCGSQLSVVCQNAHLHALGMGVSPRHVHLVPNGVDSAVYDSLQSARWLQLRLGLEPATPLVGYVGRLAPEKNPLAFVNAALQIRDAAPTTQFVLVGDGPLRGALQARIDDADAGDFIHLAGEIANMPAVYASLRFLVMTSDSEGMPLALMEAMAAGRAVIATQVGGIPEILRAGGTGLLVAPGHVDGVAAAAIGLLGDSARCAAMGVAAKEHVAACFPHGRTVEAFAALLQDLARKRPAPSRPAGRIGVSGNSGR